LSERTGWPKNHSLAAGQTFLRALGIDIAFSREGRVGSRIITNSAKYRQYRQQRLRPAFTATGR
jgi:hypothetical protein